MFMLHHFISMDNMRKKTECDQREREREREREKEKNENTYRQRKVVKKNISIYNHSLSGITGAINLYMILFLILNNFQC